MEGTTEVDHWLKEYGARLGARLALVRGQCAIVDSTQREVVVVEVPPSGDIVLLHCQLDELPQDASTGYLSNLLMLNFDTDAMRGCWLALDEKRHLRMCNQQPLVGMTQAAFIAVIEGFIQQGYEVREYLSSLPSGRNG